MPDYVQPGEPLRRSASEYNSFLDAAEWVKANIYPRGGPDRGRTWDADSVWIYNNTEQGLDAFEVIELGDVAIKDPDTSTVDGSLQIVINGNTPTHNIRHTAVVQQPLAGAVGSGGVGKAWVSGVHPALVNVGNVLHRRASAANNSYVLTSDMIGPYQILNALSSSGQQTCIVKKGNRNSIKLAGVTGSGGISAATWSSGGSGCDCFELTPGSGTVTLLLWDAANLKYEKSTLTMTVYNVADAVEGCKGILFSTDDDGCPTVDVESCTVSCE